VLRYQYDWEEIDWEEMFFIFKRQPLIMSTLIRVSLLVLIIGCFACEAEAFQSTARSLQKIAGQQSNANNNLAKSFWQARAKQAAQQQYQVMVQNRAEAMSYVKTSKTRLPALQKQVKTAQARVSKLPSVDATQNKIKAARDLHDAAVEELKAAKEESSDEPPAVLIDNELATKNKLKAKKDELRKIEGAIRELNKIKKEIADMKENVPFANQYIAQTNKFFTKGNNRNNNNNSRNNSNRKKNTNKKKKKK